MVSSFYIKSLVPASSDALVAFDVCTSSKVPYKVEPQCGFIKPGQFRQIAIMWPIDGNFDQDLISLTNFYVKSLPIQPEYFEELNEKCPGDIDFENIDQLPTIEVFKMFNDQNNRVLFTMFSVGCYIYEDLGVGKQPPMPDLAVFKEETSIVNQLVW